MGPSPHAARSVTMATVARIAGVTQATVSRALNTPEKVSPATRDRIKHAVEITGYVPNLVAGALASSKSKMLAAVVPSITNIVYSALVHNFIELVREAGYQTILVEAGFSADEEEALVSSLLARRPDGLLLTGVHHTNACRSQLLKSNIPVVEVWDLTESPINVCVGFSHAQAGVHVARFAHEKNFSKAAVVAAGDERARRRQIAFCKEFEALGHDAPVEYCFEGSASIKRGREALGILLRHGMQERVIFCSSDLLAHGVIIEAQARGLKIPGDFSLIGFGDQGYAQDLLPALSTVRVDRAELGRRAASALLTQVETKVRGEVAIDIGFEIIERQSTA